MMKWAKIGGWVLKIGMLALFIYFFEYKAMAGILIYFIIYSFYACWKGREYIIMLKHQIESVIWGRPLKYFTKEELKNTKVQFVWKKKGEGIMEYRTKDQMESEAKKLRMYYTGLMLVGYFSFGFGFAINNGGLLWMSMAFLFGSIYPLVGMQSNLIRLELRDKRKC